MQFYVMGRIKWKDGEVSEGARATRIVGGRNVRNAEDAKRFYVEELKRQGAVSVTVEGVEEDTYVNSPGA